MTKDTVCQELVKKVSALLKKNLNGLQSNFLLKTRILQTETGQTELSVAGDDTKKCDAISTIAKFYVQIGSLFAAITASVYKPKMAVDDLLEAPEPVAQAPVGQAPAKENPFNAVQSGGAAYLGEPYNFCSERLKTLINGQNYQAFAVSNTSILVPNAPTLDPNAPMIINPSICTINKNATNNLAHEPGIAELHTLYYDEYDLREGKFTGMSEEMKKVYKKDLQLFYKSFYGENAVLPASSASFSDISLNDYAKDNSGCAVNGIYNTPYKGTLSDRLFKGYAEHIKTMEDRMKQNQNRLLKVLDELFIVKKDEKIEKSIITLNPDLNDRKLQRLTQTTRDSIIEMMLTCEKDYKDGIQIYQQIVDTKLKNFIPAKKRGLNEKINELMSSSFVKGGANGVGTNTNTNTNTNSIISPDFFVEKTRKIAYDFDGVIHSYVGPPDKNGQRGALSSNLTYLLKFPFRKIIDQIQEYYKKGYEQFIVSARNDMSFIIDYLRKIQITEQMIPDENVLSAWSDVKWEMLAQKEINEFYDDSCIVILNIQKHRMKPALKYLDNLFLVFPENENWIEIGKNQKLDLQTCINIKN